MHVSWWALNPDGTYNVALPDVVSWTLSPVSGSPGTINLSYPVDGRGFDVLRSQVTQDRDLQVAIWIAGGDIGSLRGYLNTSDLDDVAESGVATFSGNLLPVRMEEAVVKPRTVVVDPPAGPAPTTDLAAFRVYAATAGQVMATLQQEAQGRGTHTDIVWTFTNSVDSFGTAWTRTATLKFAPGTTHLKVLESLVNAQMCEWDLIWNGEAPELVMWETGTRGVDHTAKPVPLILRAGRDLTESPRKHSVRDAGTHLLLAGGEGLYQEFNDPTALARRGRRIERFNSQGSYTDPGSLAAFGAAKLPEIVAGVMEVGHGVAVDDGAPRPLVDYAVGDLVLSDTGRGLESLRIAQLTVSGDADGILTAGLSLNDLISDELTRQSRRIDDLEGGGTVVGTSSPPGDGAPDPVDTMPPAAPQGVVVESLAQPSPETVPRSAVTAQWGEVLTNADLTAIDDLAGYIVQWRYLDPALVTNWRQLAQVDTEIANWSEVNAGEPIEVRVAAVDTSGNQGEWSSPSGFHTTETDATAPPIPSALAVVEFLGTLTTAWDGLGALGEPMPPDFDEAHIYRAESNNFGDAVYLDALNGAGARNYPDLPVDVEQFFWLVTVDRTGNTSDESAVASATPRRIGFGDIAFSNPGNYVEDGSFELAGSRATHAARSAAAWTFVQGAVGDPAEHGEWFARGLGATGSGIRALVLSEPVPVVPDDQLALRFALRRASGNGTLSARIRWFNAAGATIIDNLLTYGVSEPNNVWTEKEVSPYTAPAGAVAFQVLITLDAGCTTGSWDVDRVEVREMLGTLLIQAAAITDAKIANLSVGKLIAGTLTAVVNNSGVVQSGPVVAGVARYRLDANGLVFTDTGGNVSINLDRATASATLTGTVQTGRTGRRVVLSGVGNELRFYPQAGETRFGRLYSYIPDNYPNDIAVEMRAIDSDDVDYIARMYLLPDRAGLIVSPQGNDEARISGLVVEPDVMRTEFYDKPNGAALDGGYIQLRRRGIDDGNIAVFGQLSSGQNRYLRFTVNGMEFVRDGQFRQVMGPDGTAIYGTALLARAAGLANGRLPIAAQGGADIMFYFAAGQLNIGYQSSGDFIKTFVIDHPADSSRHLVHATTESPHAGTEYWGTATVEDGQAVVELPDYFEALNRQEGRGVQVTVIAEDDPADRLKLKRKTPRKDRPRLRPAFIPTADIDTDDMIEIAAPQDPPPGLPSQVQATYPRDGRFTIYGYGPVDTFRVSWLVKAIRKDVEPFDVEPLKAAGRVRGDGPYTYFVPAPKAG